VKLRIAILAGIVSASSFVCASGTYAASGVLSGTVADVRTYDPGTSVVPPRFLFNLNGVTSAGNCILLNGLVGFSGNSKEMFIAVLSGQLTGRTISVWFDDAYKVGNYCVARGVFTADPPAGN
jgi:hypothetical protein